MCHCACDTLLLLAGHHLDLALQAVCAGIQAECKRGWACNTPHQQWILTNKRVNNDDVGVLHLGHTRAGATARWGV